jgi:hypothetical protein
MPAYSIHKRSRQGRRCKAANLHTFSDGLSNSILKTPEAFVAKGDRPIMSAVTHSDLRNILRRIRTRSSAHYLSFLVMKEQSLLRMYLSSVSNCPAYVLIDYSSQRLRVVTLPQRVRSMVVGRRALAAVVGMDWMKIRRWVIKVGHPHYLDCISILLLFS